MIGCDISKPWVSDWCLSVCVCVWGQTEEERKKGSCDNSAEECDVFEVMWNTAGPLNNLQEGYHDTTRKWLGHESGQKARLCWQHPSRSIHNSHSSTSWEPRSVAARLKELRPHRKRRADVTDQSTESHCWQWEVCAERKTSPRKCCSCQIQTTSWSISLVKTPARFSILIPDREKCPCWF